MRYRARPCRRVPSIEPWTAERRGEIAARDADEPLHPQAIGGAFDPPPLGGYGMPEQRARNRLLRYAFEERISGAQLEDPLRRTPFAGQKRSGQPTLPGEKDELPERLDLRLCRCEPRHAMLHQSRSAEQRAIVKIEANRPVPVTEQPMLDMRRVDLDRHSDIILRPWQARGG